MSVCLSVHMKLWGSLESPKMIRFGWNLVHLFLGWISGGFFFYFLKIFIFGPWGPNWPENLWGSLERPKMVGFGWNLVHLFFGWVFFSFFENFLLGPKWLDLACKVRCSWRLKLSLFLLMILEFIYSFFMFVCLNYT